MPNQKEKILPKEARMVSRIPFRREKPSERPTLRIMDWLRQRRFHRGMRDVHYMPYEEEHPEIDHKR